jgi:hypothetical protein
LLSVVEAHYLRTHARAVADLDPGLDLVPDMLYDADDLVSDDRVCKSEPQAPWWVIVGLSPHIEHVVDHSKVRSLFRVWEEAKVGVMNGLRRVLNGKVPVRDGSTCAMLFMVVGVVGVVTVVEGEEGGRT